MSGTLAYAVKRFLVDQLGELPSLEGVQTAYSYPGRTIERECVYGGRSAGSSELAAFSPAGQPVRRTENFTVDLVIWVFTPGESDTAAAEARAVEIGSAVETWIDNNPTFAGDIPKLLKAYVAGFELDSGLTDDGAVAELVYSIAVQTYLT